MVRIPLFLHGASGTFDNLSLRRKVDRRWPISSGCEIVRRCGANRELGIVSSALRVVMSTWDVLSVFLAPNRGRGQT